jgi:hypothetical protein
MDLLQDMHGPKASQSTPLQDLQQMYPQDGPSLSVDVQLCGSPQPSLLLLLCCVHVARDLIHGPLHLGQGLCPHQRHQCKLNYVMQCEPLVFEPPPNFEWTPLKLLPTINFSSLSLQPTILSIVETLGMVSLSVCLYFLKQLNVMYGNVAGEQCVTGKGGPASLSVGELSGHDCLLCVCWSDCSPDHSGRLARLPRVVQ